MEPLSDKRKGEIALLVLKGILRQKGICLSSDMKEDALKEAKKMGIPASEAEQFFEDLVRELVEEVFSKKENK